MPTGVGAFSGLIAPDLRKVYMETGKERPKEYSMLFNTPPMEWNPVKDLQITGLGTTPAMPEGTTFTRDEPIQGATKQYAAVPYGLAVEITKVMWRDDLYGVMRELAAELGRSSRNRMEVDAWSIINNGFATTAGTTAVGFTAAESLFAVTHTGLDGVVRANRPSPDVGFSITGIQNAIIRFENQTDERGLPRVMAPVMAVIAPANKFVAREILGSTGKPYTADNELNALIEEDLAWMVTHYLTTSTNWFLTAAKGVHDLNFFIRDQPIMDNFDDPWSMNAVFTVWQRHVGSWGSWRGVDGSTG